MSVGGDSSIGPTLGINMPTKMLQSVAWHLHGMVYHGNNTHFTPRSTAQPLISTLRTCLLSHVGFDTNITDCTRPPSDMTAGNALRWRAVQSPCDRTADLCRLRQRGNMGVRNTGVSHGWFMSWAVYVLLPTVAGAGSVSQEGKCVC